MSYTPTSWNTGDTITAAAMNKIENGIANANAGNIMIVEIEDDDGDFVMNKTYAEIYNALKDGIPCYAHNPTRATTNIDSAYVTWADLSPIVLAYKYDIKYRILVGGASALYFSSVTDTLGTPAVQVFAADVSTDNPVWIKRVYVPSNYLVLDANYQG